MALDLLIPGGLAAKIPRLYRHELERLIWILPWVFIQYKDGERTEGTLEEWHTGSPTQYLAVKKISRNPVGP